MGYYDNSLQVFFFFFFEKQLFNLQVDGESLR